jgi:hypothetical protein
MNWDVDGVDYSPEFFGSLEPADILYEFDGPRIFTTTTPRHDTFLAYQCAEADDGNRYIVVPANAELVHELRSGLVSMREALSQPWTWLVDQLHSGEVVRARKVDLRELPVSALPRPGVLLLPSLRPMLSLRMMGTGLGRGNVPASVIRRAVEGATTALKVLAEWALQTTPSGGRPEEKLRRLYDLPTQRIAFASFEIAFAPPPPMKQTSFIKGENETLERIGALLQKGLDWASAPQVEAVASSQEFSVILEALINLAPPKHGVVTEVHLGGRLAGAIAGPRVLTRASSDRVRRELRSIRADVRPVKEPGFVREFDKDKLTFILRNEAGGDIGKCSFPESLYDDALAAFDGEELVTVLGHKSAARDAIDILSILRTPTPDAAT